MNERLQSFRFENMAVLNFEMESSALFFLSNQLGHRATTICLGIANRARMEFSNGYEKQMNELISYVLDRI
jgi:uridine phosphorylase